MRQPPNTQTPAEVLAVVKRDVARMEDQLWLIGVVREAMTAFDGKPLSKRLVTAVQKRLDELAGVNAYYVRWDTQYGMYHVNIQNCADNLKNDDMGRAPVNSLIGHHGSITAFDLKAWLGYNQCYLLNAERLPRLRDAVDHVVEWCEQRDWIAQQQATLKASMVAQECGYLFG